jgi:hypothetical protein
VPEAICWGRNGQPVLMVKKEGLIPIPEHSFAAGRQGAGRSPATETNSRADSSPHIPTMAAMAGDATLLEHPTSGARPDNSATIRHPCELWTGEVDRLFTAALLELRRGAEQALAAVEQRRIAQLTELSSAVTKQHDIIDALKREIAEIRQAAALKLAEAEQQWQRSEADRMKAARAAWELEKEQLEQEADRHRTVAEQLADQLAALKVTEASKERQYIERLKEITAEVDRCLLRARAEWVSEVARMADGADWQLPSFLKSPA